MKHTQRLELSAPETISPTSSTNLNSDDLPTTDQYPPGDAPPSYTIAQTSAPLTSLVRPISVQTTTIPFDAYFPPHSTLSSDQLTVTTMLPSLTSDAQALVRLIQEQASLPPRPLVKIRGQHSEYGASYGPDKVDFDLTLDLTGLLGENGGAVEVVPAEKVRIGKSEKTLDRQYGVGLEEWAAKFCNDAHGSKRCVPSQKAHLSLAPSTPFICFSSLPPCLLLLQRLSSAASHLLHR